MSGKDSILYEVRGNIAVITINIPKQLNAMGFEEYEKLDEAVDRAAKDPNTLITLIQSTGKFFSAGANVTSVGGIVHDPKLPDRENYLNLKSFYRSTFVSRNYNLTSNFFEHPKVLVVALNGPVIGLTASLVAFADFIYAKDQGSYLLVPFSNIGLVSEGAAALTLVQRLGHSLASEALLSAKPINGQRLYQQGFVNEIWEKGHFKSTEEFNEHIFKLIQQKFSGLVPKSVLDIKELMRQASRKEVNNLNGLEVIQGLELFANNIPQQRFAQLASKQRRHKM